MRNKRGADMGSDHHLLIAHIRVKIPAIKNNALLSQIKFNVEKLKDEVTTTLNARGRKSKI